MKKILILILSMNALCLNAQVVNEDFDSSDAGWVGSSDFGSNYWEWGTPSGTSINDDNSGGGNAWVTGLTGDFTLNDPEDVLFLNSPAYDLSGLSTSGSVSLAINYDLGSGDGAILQFSFDQFDWFDIGIPGTGTNWYDEFDFAWIGNSGGWVTATHELPMEVLGESTVYFRIVFFTLAPAGPYGNEGFALDDFQVLSGSGGGAGGGSGGGSSSSEADAQILSMSLDGELFPAAVDRTSKQVKIFVAPATDVTSLTPSITLSDGAFTDIPQDSILDFSSPIAYTVTSSDSATTVQWEVSLVVPNAGISVFPQSGIAGTLVSLYGRGFSLIASENSVSLGGELVNVISASSTKLTFEVPSASDLGLREVTVTANGVSSSNAHFNVLASNVTGIYDEYKETDFNLQASSFVSSMDVGDIDGDGDLDLVYDNESILNIATLENGRIQSEVTKVSGRGGFSETLTDLTLADLDGDSILDVVAGGDRLGWYKHNQDGTWADEVVIDNTSFGYQVRVFDMDGDLDLDILSGNGSDFYAFTNDGSGAFTTSLTTVPSKLGTVIDWDEDGDIDMLWHGGASNGEIHFVVNDGQGNFSDSILVATSTTDIDHVQLGDIDNDGDQDIVYSTSKFISSISTIGYILNNGDGTFSSATDFFTEGVFSTKKMVLADLNNDGFLDIGRTKNDGSDNIFQIHLSSSVLTYSTPQTLDSNAGGSDLVFIDVEQDGDMDILQEASQSGGYFPLFLQLLEDANIAGFSLLEQTGAAIIDTTNQTITIEVDTSANIAALTPEVKFSPGASISPSAGNTLDFSSAQVYTVTPENPSITSKVWTATVHQVPQTPVLSFADVEQNTANVSWEVTNDAAEGFELEISTNDDFSSLLIGYDPLMIDSGSLRSSSLSGLTAGTTYFVRVRGENALGTFSDYSDAVELLTKPSNPVLTNVPLENIGQDNFLVVWDTVPGTVDNYSLEVALNETFSTLLEGFPVTLSALEFIVGSDSGTTALTANTTYWVRVVANNASGPSGYSDSIAVLTTPDAPVVGEITATSITNTSVAVSWSTTLESDGMYEIEISTTDFAQETTLLDGYPLAVEGTSVTIGTDLGTAPLEPATNYWIRIRATNDSGESPNSNVVMILTRPNAPVALPATTVVAASFNANWRAVNGAEDYTLEVSTDDFGTLLFSETTVDTTFNIGGLNAGVIYKYRVLGSNTTGVSAYSNEITLTTNFIPEDLALDNQAVNENQPDSTVIGTLITSDKDDNAHVYTLIEGTGSADNGSFAIQGANLITNETFNFEIRDQYSVRVRSTDPKGGTIESSFVIEVLDLNDAPTAISIETADYSPAGFDSIGTRVADLFVTDEDGDEVSFELVGGVDSFSVNNTTKTLLTAMVFDNEEDLVLPIALKATDPEGASVIQSFDITINAFVDVTAPDISPFPTNSETFLSGGPELILGAAVTDFRLDSVNFHSRLLTESAFTSVPITEENGLFSKSILEEDLGVAGIEYFFEAIDEAGNISTTTPGKMVLEFPNSGENAPKVESVTKHGRTVENYQIISIPFIFSNSEDSRVDAIFNEYGSPDNRNWRIIKWDIASEELVNLSAASRILPGEGYYFIAAEERQITIENAQINTQDPFALELKTGWNLIGNPYNVDIDWTSVLENNGAEDIVRPLRVLDSENPELWPENSILKKLEGGFVLSTQDITLDISYQDASISFGGTGARLSDATVDLDWHLPIRLEQHGNVRLGGVGMDSDASNSFDRYDELKLPKWLKYLDIDFLHPGEQFDRYSLDIIAPTAFKVWDFEVTSSENGRSTLKWGASSDHLNIKLLDVESGQVIDMTEVNEYVFDLNGVKRFRMLYSTDLSDDFDFDKPQVSEAYPNPFSQAFEVVIHVPDEGQYLAKISLMELSGKTVWESETYDLGSGAQKISANPSHGLKPGVYLYQVELSDQLNITTTTQKIILK